MIKVTDLTKQYGKITAVDHISFEIDDGEVVGFLGPNGAGKTTTMNMLCGYISSTSGEVLIDGHDILKEPLEAKKCIGYLPEHPPLYTDMEVYEYLGFVYDLKKVRDNKKQHIQTIMEKVGLTDVQNRIIKNLSKGYQQRVGFAQALIGNPKVLILDEPTVGLDPNQIVEIRKLIEELGKAHTVILSSHILGEISAVCSKIIIIKKGTIIAMDETDALLKKADTANKVSLKVMGEDVLALLNQSGVVLDVVEEQRLDDGTQTFIVTLNENPDGIKLLSKSLSEHGIVILELQKKATTTLEQVFAELTAKEETKVNESHIKA